MKKGGGIQDYEGTGGEAGKAIRQKKMMTTLKLFYI
jgi:hypothetical protein